MNNPFDDYPIEAELVEKGDTHDTQPYPSERMIIWDDVKKSHPTEESFAYLGNAILGIILAGLLYPAVLAIVGTFISALTGNTGDLETLVAVAMMFSIIGGIIGAMISSITGTLAVILIWAMNRSVGNPVHRQTAAMSAGSMAGYIPTVWILFTPAMEDASQMLVMGFMGPILAMLLGAFGAASTAYRFGSPDFPDYVSAPYRLSISRLMIGTAWVAGIFGLANLFGGQGFAIAVGGWFFLQAILIGLAKIYRNFRPRRPRQAQSRR